ncbi:MAG: DUF3373 family protein [Wolinella sp.]
MKQNRAKVSLILATLLLTAGIAHADEAQMRKEIESLRAELKSIKSDLSAVKKMSYGDNIKLSADFRYSIDNLTYKHANGKTSSNPDLMTNRLIIGMKYAPTDNLAFISDLSYKKVFGDTAENMQSSVNSGYREFGWVTHESGATDNSIKVRQAYFLYRDSNSTIPWAASVGRRPSLNGYPVNLRENDEPNSPAGHLINVEFDGASLKLDLDKISDISGMYFKLCLGRGVSNVKTHFPLYQAITPYAKDKAIHDNVNMIGFIFVPYDDGQYKVFTNFAYASNVTGFTKTDINDNFHAWKTFLSSTTGLNPIDISNFHKLRLKFKNVGDWWGGAITFGIDGIGDGLGDFFDETKFFISFATSRTAPKSGMSMLGSDKSKIGYSIYTGVQMPLPFSKGAKLGIEYNRGSKYWRSNTHGEDTLIGSKLAARGNAYEIYYIQPLVGNMLTMDLRATHIRYNYTGSDSYFGHEGRPMSIGEAYALHKKYPIAPIPVEKATDIRLSFRYRY